MVRLAYVVALLLVFSVGFPLAYAGHGGGSSGGGGGCGGPCIPPTLGVNSDGKVRVNGGLSINSMSFDVEYYSQYIPTQTFRTGEQVSVVLKIFDNEGPLTLEHVELHFSPYEEFVSGSFVEKSVAALVWDNKDDDEVIGIYDDDDILKNVSINSRVENQFNIISFEFESNSELEKTSLMTVIWDSNKNSVKNYFFDSIRMIDLSVPSLPRETNDDDVNVVPTWIKTSAGWWADEKISDADFLGGVEFMIQTNVLSFQTTSDGENISESGEIPSWIKSTAKWWSEDLIPEDDFVSGIQFLIDNGMISL